MIAGVHFSFFCCSDTFPYYNIFIFMKDSHYYLIPPCTDDRLFQILCVWKYLYFALCFNWYIFLATEFEFAKNLLQHFFKKVFVLPSSFMYTCGPMCLYIYHMPVHSSYLWTWEKEELDPLELQSQGAASCLMWVMGINPRSSDRVAGWQPWSIPGCSLSHCSSHFDIALHLLAGVASDHTLIFCGGRLGSHCAVCAVLEFPHKTSWPWICSAPLPLFPECWDWRRGHSACRCYLCSPVCKSFTPHTLGALLQHSRSAVVSLKFKDGFYSSLLTPSTHPGNAQSLLWTHSFYLSNSAWLRSCLNFPFLSPQPGHLHLGSKRWLITGLTSFKYHFSGITALSVWCSVPEGC